MAKRSSAKQSKTSKKSSTPKTVHPTVHARTRSTTKAASINPTRFTKKTIDFLQRSSEQKSLKWLDENKKEHEDVVVAPLRALAEKILFELSGTSDARGFKFPRKGFGRLRRPSHKIKPGQAAYRGWVHMQASRPSASIFDENPGLYFYISPERIFSGGGLYAASSRQIKQVCSWLAEDPKDLTKLFKSKAFAAEFPDGFQTDKILKTFPRSYPIDHKRIDWLRLQTYYVTRDFTKREFYSVEFGDMIVENWRQVLRFDTLLSEALAADLWLPGQSKGAKEDLADDVGEGSGDEAGELWDDRL